MTTTQFKAAARKEWHRWFDSLRLPHNANPRAAYAPPESAQPVDSLFRTAAVHHESAHAVGLILEIPHRLGDMIQSAQVNNDGTGEIQYRWDEKLPIMQRAAALAYGGAGVWVFNSQFRKRFSCGDEGDYQQACDLMPYGELHSTVWHDLQCSATRRLHRNWALFNEIIREFDDTNYVSGQTIAKIVGMRQLYY